MSYGMDSIKYEDGRVLFAKERLIDIVYDSDFESSDITDDEFENVDKAKVIENKMTSASRWSILYDCVFMLGDKFYRTGYSKGSTEIQDEGPFEYEDDWIEVTEVVPKEVTVTKYIPKESDVLSV